MAKEESSGEFDPIEYKVRPDFALTGAIRPDDTAEQIEEKVKAAQAEAMLPPEEPKAEPAP